MAVKGREREGEQEDRRGEGHQRPGGIERTKHSFFISFPISLLRATRPMGGDKTTS